MSEERALYTVHREQNDLGAIYLSGPMTGLPEYNFPEFRRVAKQLYEKGFEVVNPADNVIPEYPTDRVPETKEERQKMWVAFMRKDIKAIADCDAIAVLRGWQNSRGARLEVTIAHMLGMPILDAYTLEPINLEVTVEIKEAAQ